MFLVEWRRREWRVDRDQELFGLFLQLPLRSVLCEFGRVGKSAT